MRLAKRLLAPVMVGMLGVSVATSAAAQEASGSENSYIHQSAEGFDLNLQINDQRDVVAVRIVECEGCQPTTFLPARQLKIEIGGAAVGVDRAVAANGGAGVVLYHPKTRMAEIVVFYGQ